MKYNYVFFNEPDGDTRHIYKDGYNYICLEDLRSLENVQVITIPVEEASYPIRFLYAVHNTPRINKYIKLPFRRMWFPILCNIRFNPDEPICFIVLSAFFPPDYLRYLKTIYKNSKFVKIHRDLLPVFTRCCPDFTEEVIAELFDLRMSYDKGEAKKYGLLSFDEYESRINVEISNDYPLSDVFFAAKAKDRLPLIIQAYDLFTSKGLKCDFYITGVNPEEEIPRDGIKYASKFMTYREMLYRTVNTRCVFELNQGGAVGYTSRFLEAVMYDKKLITNNLSIMDHKYYDPRFIQCFKSVNEIDVSFINDGIKVDYGYDGDFSPVHLIHKIENNL